MEGARLCRRGQVYPMSVKRAPCTEARTGKWQHETRHEEVVSSQRNSYNEGPKQELDQMQTRADVVAEWTQQRLCHWKDFRCARPGKNLN